MRPDDTSALAFALCADDADGAEGDEAWLPADAASPLWAYVSNPSGAATSR